jgi:chromosome segregation ATPase
MAPVKRKLFHLRDLKDVLSEKIMEYADDRESLEDEKIILKEVVFQQKQRIINLNRLLKNLELELGNMHEYVEELKLEISQLKVSMNDIKYILDEVFE